MTFGGRLTLASGTPVMSADTTSSTLYYTQHCGTTFPLSGSDTSFTELSLSLSGLTANGVYDVFAGSSGLFTGPAWSTGAFNSISNVTAITTDTGSNPWANPSYAFNGTVSQSVTHVARNSIANIGANNYLGQDWGAPHVISKVVIYPPNDDWMRGDLTNALPVTVRGWDATAGVWETIYTGTVNCSVNPPASPVISYTLNVISKKPYTKAQVCLSGNGTNAVSLAQVLFYEWIPASRGTALARNNGILTNSANTGTYLGTIQIDSTAGQCTAHFNYGPSRKFGVWNAYNQVPIYLQAGTTLTAYTPVSPLNIWGPLHNDTTNSLTTLTGLPQRFDITLQTTHYLGAMDGATVSGEYNFGIGLNRTDFVDGQNNSNTLEMYNFGIPTARIAYGSSSGVGLITPPMIGPNTAYALESFYNSATTCWTGQRDMMLSAKYLG